MINNSSMIWPKKLQSRIEKIESFLNLLWVNPKPEEEFIPQTINLDLSEYDVILVQFRNVNSSDDITNEVTFAFKNVYNRIDIRCDSSKMRDFVFNNAGVTFETGKYMNHISGDIILTNDGSVMIPQKIYGLNTKINREVTE